ncbi:MAG: hypothetical protein KDD47_28730 [Acidobacteria bacterium]|nr:hypothetical protein [Acidobacteriota bacterium]
MLDNDGRPIPFEEYRLTLPDGRALPGKTDKDGLAGVDGIEPGEGKLEFPNLHEKGIRGQE